MKHSAVFNPSLHMLARIIHWEWTDGPFIHTPCFWKTHSVNINGNAFAWEHNATSGEWIKQNPTVHTANLGLIAEFEELQLNDFDLVLKAHPAHT